MTRPVRAHTHVCEGCGDEYTCGWDLEQNYDGIPEVICTGVDRYGERKLCEVCEPLPICDWCGEVIHGDAVLQDDLVFCSRLCLEDSEEETTI